MKLVFVVTRAIITIAFATESFAQPKLIDFQDLQRAVSSEVKQHPLAGIRTHGGNYMSSFYDAASQLESESRSRSSGPSSSPPQAQGRMWMCQVQCRGPLFKLGSRPTIQSFGETESDARTNAKDLADKTCTPEKDISWGEVLRCR